MTADVTPLADAMLCAIRQHATAIKERADRVDFNAWWRGGDDLNVRMWPDRATWYDVVEESGGGAKDFASVVFGMELRDFLARFGTGQPSKPRPPTPIPGELWHPASAYRVWMTLVASTMQRPVPDGDAQGAEFVRRWCESRGFPVPYTAELAAFSAGDFWPDFPGFRDWLKTTVDRAGRPVVAPLRSARSGQVAALVLRFPRPPEGCPKSMTCTGAKLRDPDGTPRGYGDAGNIWRAKLGILMEGLPDTVAGQCAFQRRAVVAGAVSSGEISKWAPILGHRGRVVVVPHLDGGKSGYVGQRKSGDLVATLRASGRDAVLFDWARMLSRMEYHGIDTSGVGDFADASKACTLAGRHVGDLALGLIA